MARWAWIAIAALGCSSRTGLAIDVDLDGAASAELLAPVRPCPDCSDGIAPPGAQEPLVGAGGSGDVAYLDSPTRLLVPADGSGHAHFELQAGDIDPIPTILIVGFDASDHPTGTYAELTDVDVPRHDAVVWSVQLEPPPAGQQLIAWRQPSAPCGSSPTHASCVGIENTADSSTAFYVPADDPDCDGCTGSADCNHHWYLDTETDAPCFTERATSSGGSACEAGLGTCVDGQGPAQMSCAPIGETICVPDAVCAGGTCFDGISGCLTRSPLPPSYEVLQCTLLVSFMPAGNGEVAMMPCPMSDGVQSLPVPASMCSDAGIAVPITSLGIVLTTPSAPFTSPLLDAQQTDAVLDLKGIASPNCNLTVDWTGTLTFASTTITPALDPMYIVLDANMTTQLVLPMGITLDSNSCLTNVGMPSIHCQLDSTSDPVWGCAL